VAAVEQENSNLQAQVETLKAIKEDEKAKLQA
jgi:hypothetical protein